MNKENLKLQSQADFETKRGNFTMATFTNSQDDPMPHLVLYTKKEEWKTPLPVRIHSECITGDLFGSKRCECGDQLHLSLDYIQKYTGMLIYLRQEGRGIGIINKLKAYQLQDQGHDTAEANVKLGFHEDGRNYDDAEKILNYFGITEINLLTNNPDKLGFFKNKNIKVVQRIPLELSPNGVNDNYLKTKKDHFGHLLTKL